MKKVLIINGHPDDQSYGAALVEAYRAGGAESGAHVRVLALYELEFKVSLAHGYRKRTELEPDLLEAQRLIQWADHLVWVFPIWWGNMPALLKGFIDRVFLPGFAFAYRDNSVWWDKLLAGRSAHIINTLDQPYWYYWLVNGRPSYHAMKKMTLEFCGIKPVRVTSIGPIRKSSVGFREQWLQKINKMGRQLY
ncbi:putative NADPH-quinone reductase [Dyadobacter jejuensis]|uniref:Putative NADPH-quinone reductase n=1 Tax=Dyadobacter jejuensis TaxID=1082580 RepID=A0A316ARC0_9BACT|nr:NAD(P)H-dependent oxidoreductase [Dyadobacter jejuensis]PWJ60275.1 putative NADPH-quinone reductase [Dyadobacter jejuensis]